MAAASNLESKSKCKRQKLKTAITWLLAGSNPNSKAKGKTQKSKGKNSERQYGFWRERVGKPSQKAKVKDRIDSSLYWFRP